jgi:hypothetical protein
MARFLSSNDWGSERGLSVSPFMIRSIWTPPQRRASRDERRGIADAGWASRGPGHLEHSSVMSTGFSGLELVDDPSVATWVTEHLRGGDPLGIRVGALVPEVFEGYARILHPAYQVEGRPESAIRWSEIARRTGAELRSDTPFRRITVPPGSAVPFGPHGAWDQDARPREGSMPAEIADPLVRVLGRFTTTPGRCWFCMWEGFGFEDLNRLAAGTTARVLVSYGQDVMFTGALTVLAGSWPCWQSPNLWWPDDRAWCVATEIDDHSTYVGGSAGCIDAILQTSTLEAVATTPDAFVTRAGEWNTP